MPDKPASKPASAKKAAPVSAARREGVRQIIGPLKRSRIQRLLSSTQAAPCLAIAVLFIVLTATVAFWFRGSLLPAPQRTALDTRVVRADFAVEDPKATDRERERVRTTTPPVYRVDPAAIDAIRSAMLTLPEALAATEEMSDVAPELIEAFGLTEESYGVIKGEAEGGTASMGWVNSVGRAVDELGETPLLLNESYQRIITAGYSQLVLAPERSAEEEGTAGRRSVSKDFALPVVAEESNQQDRVRDALRRIAFRAALYGKRGEVFAERVLSEQRPTYLLDREATNELRDEALAQVESVMRTYKAGELLYAAGRPVEQDAYAVAGYEERAFREARPWYIAVGTWLGLAGVVAIIAAAIGGYLYFFYRDVLDKPWRLATIAGMLATAALFSAALATSNPALVWSAVLTPTIFVGMIAVVAYDRRMAMLIGLSSALLTALALDMGVSTIVAALAGVMLAAWKLAGIRSRNDVARGGLVTTAGVSLAVIVVGLVERPLGLTVLSELAVDAATAGAGAFLASALLLLALPTIERVFGITTGMTLAELRDPQHPLLRRLQERAPGTYNHSLTVASLAESAADAVGADALHVYVGAMYHDIGKMNKPEYFIENQPRGMNKHDKLSPAMSLLVIVGHVKDGVELAREYRLPKSLHHYIEAHHGTTLVEYFYHQAKAQADADESVDAPAEVEYRYPGPRPTTREAAILMLCDAVESATRTLSDPTPARIEALVHELARKRLMDGQFDECGLTLSQLRLIEKAVTRTLASVHHARISYPKGERPQATPGKAKEPAAVG